MERVDRAFAWLAGAASILGTACIVLMMLHVAADVVGRYFFNAPLPGTITVVAHYYMVVVVFLGLGVAERQNSHIAVEIVADLLPAIVRRGLEGLGAAISVFAFGLVAWRGAEEAIRKTAVGAAISQGSDTIPVWASYWAIPFGAGLMTLFCISRLVLAVARRRAAAQPAGTGGEVQGV